MYILIQRNMFCFAHLRNVHSARWFEAIVRYRIGLLLEQVSKLVFLNTFRAYAAT